MRPALLACLIGCSQGSSTPAPRPKPVATGTPVASVAQPAHQADVDAQVARGKQLFARCCAECHGSSGQGTDDGPPLVGTGVLPLEPRAGEGGSAKRDVKFRTAGDVYVFAMRNMPADDPASLTADEYLAIVAFALSANGVTIEAPLDAELAQAIALH